MSLVAKPLPGDLPQKKVPMLDIAGKLTVCALFIQLWLIVLHMRLAGHDTAEVRVVGLAFDLTRESSIPTAFAVVQALAAAIIAGIIGCCFRQLTIPRIRWMGWFAVMSIFLLIAADDAAAIHEKINSIVSLEIIEGFGYPSYPWHVVMFPCFAVGLVGALWLVRKDIWKSCSQKIGLGLALLCYAASQILDFAEGWEVMQANGKSLPLHMMAVEEVLEMMGTTCFCYVFLSSLLYHLPKPFPPFFGISIRPDNDETNKHDT